MKGAGDSVAVIRLTDGDFKDFPDLSTDRKKESRFRMKDIVAVRFRKEWVFILLLNYFDKLIKNLMLFDCLI